jgi:hypothetical protein
MDYTIIARRGEDGTPVAGTFEVAKRDDPRIGARGWWGGRSMMSRERAERDVSQRNGRQGWLDDTPKSSGSNQNTTNQTIKTKADGSGAGRLG